MNMVVLLDLGELRLLPRERFGPVPPSICFQNVGMVSD